MARINNFEALCDDLYKASVATGYAVKKVVRKTSTLTKSQTVQEAMLKAGLNPGELKPFTGKPATIREKGVKVGDKVLVKGKKAVTDKPVDAEPKEHTALRVARLLSEMKTAAMGRELNGKVTEVQLKAAHALAHAGEMSEAEVADVKAAMDDGRALPTYILKKLGSGNT
jgi:hypothetical protein